MLNYLDSKKIFGRHAYACADQNYQLNITLITEYPWSNLFGHNMFLRLSEADKKNFTNDWTILCAPGFKVKEPIKKGLKRDNFSIINFNEKVIIIGGTGYTGEIKVILVNLGKEDFKISHGDRIAQAVVSPVISGRWCRLNKKNKLGETNRSDGGFGSTGIN